MTSLVEVTVVLLIPSGGIDSGPVFEPDGHRDERTRQVAMDSVPDVVSPMACAKLHDNVGVHGVAFAQTTYLMQGIGLCSKPH